ncbi:DUF317 domain-containing protein [Streptomyces albus]|uniref:DUF317 domain-containing protein n=1 Tax=Streptomyces physcomitrii TaxID=2724184 RepID=UPI000591485A|nr:DUF317 domain-containing protein [Streptomyces albus]
MTSPIDTRALLDLHPAHPSAVVAFLSGAEAGSPLMGLQAAEWTVVADNVLVLARIDHEEPYWAKDAAEQLRAGGVTVEITPRLRKAMDEEWTWVNHPMPWCTRSEIREVSDQAQKIHDDIRHGQLLIHAHAHDGHTTVAVGTYRGPSGRSVHLHGEDHLRQVTRTFDSPAQALLAFEKDHAATMHPGPAPLTDTERAAAKARSSLEPVAAGPKPARPVPDAVPAYLADAGDHDALLDTFFTEHGDWEKWRTWSDETTHAIHESQTLRIERVHEATGGETAWTVAAYETPVSERAWVLTATAATPAPVLKNLLEHLAEGNGPDPAADAPMNVKTVTAATQPLADAGWKHSVEGLSTLWTSPTGDAGTRFDAFLARHHHDRDQATWALWAGPDPGRPTWTVTASSRTPTSLLVHLLEPLSDKTSHRRPQNTGATRRTSHCSKPPTAPANAARPAVNRSR